MKPPEATQKLLKPPESSRDVTETTWNQPYNNIFN